MALIFGALFIAFSWWKFHPTNAVPVVGPAGSSHRAYIEDRSFMDISFVLCVSDWPYTFLEPLSVGSVMYSEGSNARVFWSVDGSVIVVHRQGGYVAAYDYIAHELLRDRADRIYALLQSRGGLGLEQQEYPGAMTPINGSTPRCLKA